MSFMTPDEVFGPIDPKKQRKLDYVAAAHYVRSSIFARLKGNPHRSALAANCVWAGGHFHYMNERPDVGVELSDRTVMNQMAAWDRICSIDDDTLEALMTAARGCAARSPTREGSDVAKRVIDALQAIVSSRTGGDPVYYSQVPNMTLAERLK